MARRTFVSLAIAAALFAGKDPAGAQASSSPEPLTTPAFETPYGPEGVDERGLWMQVDEAERRLKNAPTLIKDPALNSYVRTVLCRTVGDKSCAGVRIYILRTPEFNASIAPNGMMIVNSGLLLRLRNEAQLAAVLGHEFTHYEHKHGLLMFQQVRKKGSQAVWLAFTGIGLLAAIDIERGLYSYSRNMEREADLGGLAKSGAAGYSQLEAAVVWSMLREEMDATAAARKQKSRKDKDRGAYSTHPATRERIVYLLEQAAKQPVGAQTGSEAYAAAMAKWWPQFAEDQIKLNDFGASDYLLNELAKPGWTPWLLYARGELYRMRAQPGDLANAVKFYGEGISVGGDPLPVLWRGRGLALLKLGKTEEGKADLKTYLAQAGDAPDRAMMTMLAGVTQ